MTDHAARAAILRMNGREALIAPQYQDGFVSDLRALAASVRETQEQLFLARRSELVAAYSLPTAEQRKPFAFSQGIAIIPVHGTLINRFAYSWGYVTGYNFIRQQTALAGQDPDVLGVIFDCNSYGGEAAGCFETAADLRGLLGSKRSMAMVDSNAYSACYGIACAADKIVVTPSGGAGSIGVVSMHVSYEEALKEMGIKVTFIHAGAHKVDGNPYEDLPDDVKAEIQKSVDKSMNAFVSHVAKHRKMDEKAVRATEARTYRAEDAKSLGLIDAVATPQAAVQAFFGELSGSTLQPRKESAMSEGTKPGAENKAPEQLAADAAAAERTRVAGILGCEEAKGRGKLAQHLALNTGMSVADAKALLLVSPTEAAAAGNPFREAMDGSKHPNVGADAEGQGGEGEKLEGAKGILAAARAAGVRNFDFPKH